MDPDGKNARTLSRNKVMMASWSRDGKRIAYFGEVEGTRGICVMDADGTGAKLVRKLEGNTAMNQGEFGPQWSADGKRLFFTGCQLANPPTAAVFAMDTDGGNVKQLTDRKVLNFLGGGTVRHVRFTISKVEKP
jgi:Tol biopolymer transport system component